MNRLTRVIAFFGVVAFIVLLAGGTVFGESNAVSALPEVVWLGEGPGPYTTPLDNFIVKRGSEEYVFVAGPTYQGTAEERVWGVRGASTAPPSVWNAVVPLGPVYQGCVVEYVGIDDDVNTVRNGFFIGSELLELVIEGMVFQGDFVIPYDSTQFRFVAEESVAGWYTPCDGGPPPATATPTSTPLPGPTATPTSTPEPGNDVIVYMPLTMYGSEVQPPPPDQYELICDQEYDISIIDEEVHFQFSATALKNDEPLPDVQLKGTVDVGSQTPSNIEETNSRGVADFFITTLITSISQSPLATVIFNDTVTYGSASCTVDFSGAAVDLDFYGWAKQ